METMALEPHRNRFYDVFEPHCKWNTFETLDVDLKGFKTEHIKVQINHNKGLLVIHGERPICGMNNNKWTRFRKTIKLSEDSNPNEIRAKFSDGVLSIQVPKQVKEQVSDIGGGEGSHHQRDSVWGIVKTNNWGAMKAALLALVVVTAGFTVGTKLAPPPPPPPPVLPNKEDVNVDRALNEPDNRSKPGFNFRFK